MKDIFLVDADDTVFDFHGASEKALKIAFHDCNIVWKEEYLEKFRRINAGLWEALERRELTRGELMERRFPLYLKHLGLQNADVKAFNEKFLHALANNPIYIDGAKNFLTELNKRGRVFIVTNGTEWIQKSRFEIANLYAYAENTFISDTIGVNKPAKGYTDYVIANIDGFSKDRAVWIGDSLSADIKAANDANITSIWFNPKGKSILGEIMPDYVVKTFDEALKILENAE